MKTKQAIRPEDALSKKSNDRWYKNCKNCGCSISSPFIKHVWEHDSEGGENPYDCQLPVPRNDKKTWGGFCKVHNYVKSKHSDALICTKCFDSMHKRDFFTNRNIYWCRSCNFKFSNIKYHKKEHHTHKIAGRTVVSAMDYIEYQSDYEEDEKVYEDKKRLWTDNGNGATYQFDIMQKERFDFHVIEYGFLSKTKMKKILQNSLHGFWWDILLAGNDRKFIKPKEKDLIYFIENNRVAIKMNHEGNVVWISPEFKGKRKKDVLSQFRNA